MKVAISAIGKLENKYIREWVIYNQNIGIDKIFLYDNNDTWGEYFESVIQDKINEGFVEIIDYRGKQVCQCLSYQESIDKYHNEYDWIAFIDCDEFITFGNGCKTISDFLSYELFDKFDTIKLNFLAYGDNNLLDNTSNSVQVFDNNGMLDIYHTGPHNFPNNLHSKTLFRCSSYSKGIFWNNDPHTPVYGKNIHACTGDGIEVIPNMSITVDVNNASNALLNISNICLKHFSTKSITEFLTTKYRRGFPDQKCNYNIDDFIGNALVFFSFNKVTHDKIHVVKKIFNEIYTDSKNIVLSEARGRIGNTLFTVATGAYYAEQTGKDYYLYVDYNNAQYMHDNGEPYIDYILKNNIFKNIHITYNIPDHVYVDCYEKTSTVYNAIPNIQGNIFIHGFRQSAKYFDRDWARKFFEPSNELIDEIYTLYPNINFDTTVSVNVRRGDYLNPQNSWICQVNTAEWYKNIMHTFGEAQLFIIVSDDIPWCKQQFKDYNCIYIDKQTDNKIFVDLFIQTLCKDNIISNSTFSWWAAYLNKHNNRKVYYREPWFKSIDCTDAIPTNDNWINI